MFNLEPSLFSLNIVNILSVSATGIFRWFRRKGEGLDVFGTPDTEAYVNRNFPDGTTRLERVLSKKEIGKLGINDMLLVVNTGHFGAELVFPDLCGKEGVRLDVTVTVTCQVSNPRKFLQECALSWITTSDSVSITQLETLLLTRCKQAVTDELSTVEYDAVKQRDALPGSWWLKKLPEWIRADWLSVIEVKEVRYESATADKVAEIARRREQTELEAKSQQQIHECEIRMQQDQLEYENAQKELELIAGLHEKERQARLKQAELAHEKVIVEATAEIEQIRIKSRKERAELEAEIDRLRSREDLAAERLKQAEESERRTREYLEELTAAKNELGDQAELLSAAIREGLADAKRISEFAGNTSSTTMALLGKTVGPEYMSQVLREKAKTACYAVKMKKVVVALGTRDIGNTPVDSLRINSSLQFEFMSQRSGYATVLNIGTSGTVRLHSPNAYVGIEEAKIEAGQTYSIPGRLLPVGELSRHGLSYLEVGPPGWEELAVIVSPEPLATKADMFDSTERSPFVSMSTDRIAEIVDQLAGLPEDTWSAGLLSFLVE